MHGDLGSLAQVFGGRVGLGRAWRQAGAGRSGYHLCMPPSHCRRPGRLRPCPRAGPRTGSCLGKEILLASWLQAGDGPVVGRGPGRRRCWRWRPKVLVAQEALDTIRVADECSQLHVAPARRTLVHGQTEGQAQKLGPPDVATSCTRRWRLGRLGERRWRRDAWGWRLGGACRRVWRGRRNDQGPPVGRGGKHTHPARQHEDAD